MIDCSRRILLALLVLVLLSHGGSTSAAETEQKFNIMCPVMTDVEATPEITLLYRGHEVRFCCTECRREFLANPEKYLDQLPHIAPPNLMEDAWAMLNGNTNLALIGSLVVGLAWLRLARRRWTREHEAENETDPLKNLLTMTVSPTIPLLLLLAFAAYEIYLLDGRMFYHLLEEDIHFATFHDYGTPPAPAKPKHEPRLAGTYYRGNDERSELLFNGGNYCTAVFNVALVTSDGQPLDYGQPIPSGPVSVRLEIVRPEHTPDFLYSDRFMKAMYLTQESSASLGRDSLVADRVELRELELMQRWDAHYEVAECSNCIPKNGTLKGIVYVCEEKKFRKHRYATKDSIGGARFHYGIAFQLVLEEGVIAEGSQLYMSSLYRTRKFPIHEVPFNQWFGEDPIPLLPGKNTEDPRLLGIEDYLQDG